MLEKYLGIKREDVAAVANFSNNSILRGILESVGSGRLKLQGGALKMYNESARKYNCRDISLCCADEFSVADIVPVLS